MRSSFALELAVRAGDVREILWPDDKPENMVNSRRKATWIRLSDRFDRYLAKLVSYSNVGGESFEELLARFPKLLERMIDEGDSDLSGGECVSSIVRIVARGVVVDDKQEAIFREVVGACRTLAHRPSGLGDDDSPTLDWVDYDDTYLVDAVEVLSKAGYTDLAYELFSLIPEKSDLGCYAVTALANSAASHGDPHDPGHPARPRALAATPRGLRRRSCSVFHCPMGSGSAPLNAAGRALVPQWRPSELAGSAAGPLLEPLLTIAGLNAPTRVEQPMRSAGKHSRAEKWRNHEDRRTPEAAPLGMG